MTKPIVVNFNPNETLFVEGGNSYRVVVGSSIVEVIEVEDGMFNLNSTVILPEAERPSQDAHESLTTVGIFATALVHAQSTPEARLLVAGHTDTSGTIELNQELSEQRALITLCCLEGTQVSTHRDTFATLCDDRHIVSDYKQILSWASKVFGFNCHPGKIDDNEFSGINAVKGFQADYNTNRTELAVPEAEELAVDGDMGPKTWGAIFDCYEAALAKEISDKSTPEERASELAELRKILLFADDSVKSKGYSEHYPIDKIDRDNVKSLSNRRVELLFFITGNEPNLSLPPRESEIYTSGRYERLPIPVPKSAIEELDNLSQVNYLLRSNSGSIALTNMSYTLDVDGRIIEGKTDDNGLVHANRLPPGDFTLTMNDKTTILGSLPSQAKPVIHIFHGFMIDDGLDSAPTLSEPQTES